MARKILLADDSVTAQNMGRKILADAGYEVITVNNGSAALKKIAELKPDLIVLDVYMPGYSGLEVCQRLKEVAESARTPVLLTVGKLEPFKPEEAKRVRADGYIVKPFEASELLSALSKLEDKIVPRAEASKPGRLARATAAIEESRTDKAASSEEDSGWKSRISFPSKKKKDLSAADGDDQAIYNAVNKDLRTVVEHRPSDSAKNAAEEDERVDLGALAPEGLPKDVTAEEIAALSAAAAQVQGKILENGAESLNETVVSPDVASATANAISAQEPPSPELSEAVAPAATQDAPVQPVEASVASSDSASSVNTVENAEPGVPQDQHSDASHIQFANDQSTNEPATMAAVASADSGLASSRWIAVAVALAPEDSGVSLEQEMSQTYAAYASAEVGQAVSAVAPSSESAAVEPSSDHQTEAITSAEPAPEAKSAVEFETVPTGSSPESASDSSSSALSDSAPSSETAAPQMADPVAQQPSSELNESAGAYSEISPPEVASVPPDDSDQVSQEESNPESNVPSSPSPMQEEGREPVSTLAIEAAVEGESALTAHPELQNKESDIAATTAAAWASWRRVRESASPQDSPSSESSGNAMAVAAGAENAPEEAADLESDPAIASIVDSVLAGLRPRIVEEITRKLGKKK